MKYIVFIIFLLTLSTVSVGLGQSSPTQNTDSIEAVTSMDTIVPLATGATSVTIGYHGNGDFGTIYQGDNSNTAMNLEVGATGGLWQLSVKSSNVATPIGANLYNARNSASLQNPLRVSITDPNNSPQYTNQLTLTTDDQPILSNENPVSPPIYLPIIYWQLVTWNDKSYGSAGPGDYRTTITWTISAQV